MKSLFQVVFYLVLSSSLFAQLKSKNIYIEGNSIFIAEPFSKTVLRVGGQLKSHVKVHHYVHENEKKNIKKDIIQFVGVSLLNSRTLIVDQRENANTFFSSDRNGLLPFLVLSGNYTFVWRNTKRKSFSFFSTEFGFSYLLKKDVTLFIGGTSGYCYEYIKTGNGLFYSFEYGKQFIIDDNFSLNFSVYQAAQITRIKKAELYLFDVDDQLLSVENLKTNTNINPLMGIKLGLMYKLN